MLPDLTEEQLEKLLLDEYKIGMDAYYRSETIYANRENFFFVAMGILVSAIVGLLKLDTNYGYISLIIILIVTFLGFILSSIWFGMESKSCSLSNNRLDHLKKIEEKLSGLYLNHKDLFQFFTDTGKSPNKCEISTWDLRKKMVFSFGVFWLIIFFIFLFKLDLLFIEFNIKPS